MLVPASAQSGGRMAWSDGYYYTHKGVRFYVQVEKSSKDGSQPYWSGLATCKGQRHGGKCKVRLDTKSADIGKFKSETAAKRDLVKRMKAHIEKEHRN